MGIMFKPRLQRLRWVYADRPVYFLTTCTTVRRPLLANRNVHETFMEFAKTAAGEGVWGGRYVLMPDHIHLFAAFSPRSPTLSVWVKALKGSISKDLRHSGLPSPFWQKGFFDHVMRSAESYQQKWAYVRQNPVRAGLVKDPSDWPYQGEIHPLSL